MQDRIRHAKSYPFSIPERSYVYDNGTTRRLDHAEIRRHGRVPVLAAGSNQSPLQIHRKFADLAGDIVIPSQRGRLHDFDVVYAAHLTSYGSVPATFQASPGTAVTVFVLWLDEVQLARMHETEGNYTYDRLDDIRIQFDGGGGGLEGAYAYSSRVGCLNRGGECVGVAEIAAEGRRFEAMAQPEMLAHVRDRLTPGRTLDGFVRDHLEAPAVHRARSAALGADALPLAFERRVVLRLPGPQVPG